MPSKTESLFSTVIVRGSLSGASSLNRKLLDEVDSFRTQDHMGRDWSKKNYRGGYTSYASLNDMHFRSPLFAGLSDKLQPHAESFAREQGWDLRGWDLEMTDLWMNVMPQKTYHGSHLHPHSVISGTYFVSSPPGATSLKIEDPRMAFYMNAPVRARAKKENATFYEIAPKPGSFVMFESWLRHEVPPNLSTEPRVSLSFNYSVKEKDSD